MRGVVVVLALIACSIGCTRAYYRRQADEETYGAIAERTDDPQWPVGNIGIDAPPESRLYDPFDPNRPPMPPDDPAAQRYMIRADGHRGSLHWHDDGDADYIESPLWREFLKVNKDGRVVLTPESSVELGLLDSREYQTALENLYSSALLLTLNRFEFALHWFAINDTVFTQSGSSATEINTLTTSSNAGFTKAFTGGGQLLVEFANSFVFTFSGVNHTFVNSNIIINFIQPLLRGAGRKFRMETLTQGERNVLYAVRDFARFRKQFAVNITTRGMSGFLTLLLQVQNIRNLEQNLLSQEKNYKLHELLRQVNVVTAIQRDQAFQSYQQSKLALLQVKIAYETSLDTFKTTLGLPPNMPVEIDDSLLAPFQLNEPALEKLQGEIETFFGEYRELDRAPELAKLRDGFTRLRQFHARTVKMVADVQKELARWKEQVDENKQTTPEADQERANYKRLSDQIPDLQRELKELRRDIDDSAAKLTEAGRKEGWESLQIRSRKQNAALTQLLVVQTQIRVSLIKLKPTQYEEDKATNYAFSHRLDLMNQRGRVVDAWRQIAVAANLLRPGLNLTVNANVSTPPGGDSIFDFRSSSSSYSAGVAFDSPLNRKVEENNYRTSQINYQQARRNFMALEDQISAAIRFDLRSLQTEQVNFEIARQSLISAAQQVEAAEYRLLQSANAADTTITLDNLRALDDLLRAKTTLISSWINYRTDRVQLFLDMEALQLDDRGFPNEEPDPLLSQGDDSTHEHDDQLHQPTRLPPDAANEPGGKKTP
ncbi:MAG: TolC family protein [Gemmataceae bacterium]